MRLQMPFTAASAAKQAWAEAWVELSHRTILDSPDCGLADASFAMAKQQSEQARLGLS